MCSALGADTLNVITEAQIDLVAEMSRRPTLRNKSRNGIFDPFSF